LQVIAAIQRQVHNLLIADHVTDLRRVRLQQNSVGADLDLLGHLAHRHLHVDARGLIHLQSDIAHQTGLEADLLCLDAVDAGQQRRKRIIAGFVGDCAPGLVRAGILDDDSCFRNHRPGLIAHYAEN
jgi:hypothetical protein